MVDGEGELQACGHCDSKPIPLPCGHASCWDCISPSARLRHGSSSASPTAAAPEASVKCPVCGLRSRVALGGLRDPLRGITTLSCEVCEEGAAAVLCENCGQTLCSNCFTSAHKGKFQKKHRTLDPAFVTLFCEEHGSFQTFFCKTHSIPVCSTCCAESHKTCETVSHSEGVVFASSRISEMAAAVRKLASENDVVSKSAEKFHDIEEELEAGFAQIAKKLEEEKIRLLRTLNKEKQKWTSADAEESESKAVDSDFQIAMSSASEFVLLKSPEIVKRYKNTFEQMQDTLAKLEGKSGSRPRKILHSIKLVGMKDVIQDLHAFIGKELTKISVDVTVEEFSDPSTESTSRLLKEEEEQRKIKELKEEEMRKRITEQQQLIGESIRLQSITSLELGLQDLKKVSDKSLEALPETETVEEKVDAPLLRKVEVLYPTSCFKDEQDKMVKISIWRKQIKLDFFKESPLLNYPFLQVVDLSGNELESIDTSLFRGLKFLSVLDLHGNKISHVDDSSFVDLRSLRKLILSGNKLKEVSEKLLEGLSGLSELHLYSNRISYIHDAAFKSVRRLKILDLSYNRLETLPEKLFVQLSHLEKIYLRANKKQFSSKSKPLSLLSSFCFVEV